MSMIMADDPIVRVRGTFIDVGPDVAPQKKRSYSAPPKPNGGACSTNAPHGSGYILGWMERASVLPKSFSKKQEDTCSKRTNRTLRKNALINKKCCPEKEANPCYHRMTFRANRSKLLGMERVSEGPAVSKLHLSIHASPDVLQECNSLNVPHSLKSWSPEQASTIVTTCNMQENGTPKHIYLSGRGPGKVLKKMCLEESDLIKQAPTDDSLATTEITTLMLCGIPCRQKVDQVISAINKAGFGNTYDLLYMPAKRPRISQNLGYAFINFKTPEAAVAFGEAFDNFRFPSTSSNKTCHTKRACHQGYHENFNRYMKQCAVGCLVTFDDDKQLAQVAAM